MKKLLLSLLLGFSLNIYSLQAAPRNQNCRESLILFIEQAKQTLVDPNYSYEKSMGVLKNVLGEDFYAESDLKKFEEDVEKVFKSKRNHNKNWQLLEEKWKLDPKQSLYLRAFYSFFVYEPSLVPLKTREELLSNVKKLSLKYRLKLDPELQERFDYYEKTIGKKSVPEIAKELGITQSRVYRELSYLNLSIVKAFENNFREGEDQSSRFIRHQREIESRGVSWKRNLGKISEEILLVDMHEKGMTHAEIANALNKLAGTTNPKNPDIRTERSVSYKISALGLSKPRKARSKELVLENYGPVKAEGILIPSSVTQFLIDHKDKGLKWCAQNLEVSLSGLRGFIKRQHIEVFFKNAPQAPEKTEEKPWNAFTLVQDQNVLNWVMKNNKIPHSSEEWSEALNVEAKDRVLDWIIQNQAFPHSSEDWVEAFIGKRLP